MAEILICRPLCELDALTKEQCMKNQAYLQQDGMFMQLSMARTKVYSMYGSTTTSLAKMNIMLRICQKYFIANVEQD